MAGTVLYQQTEDAFLDNYFDNSLKLIDPKYFPVVSYMMQKGMAKIATPHYNWYATSLRPNKTTLSANITDAATSLVVVDTDFGDVNTVIKIGSELMQITAYVEATGTATVTRAYGGTTAAAHTAGDTIVCLGFPNAEDGTFENNRTSKPDNYQNFVQIFTKKYGVTRQAMEAEGKGNGGLSLLALEEEKAAKHMMGEMENAFIQGIGFESGNTRMAHGISTLIEDNGIVQDETGNDISFDIIDNLAISIDNAGGEAGMLSGSYVLMVGNNQAKKINSLNVNVVNGTTEVARVVTDAKDPVLGNSVTAISTTVGTVYVWQVKSMLPTEALMVKLEDLMGRALVYPETVPLAISGQKIEFTAQTHATIQLAELPVQGKIIGLNK